MARRFTGSSERKTDPKDYVFTTVQDIGAVPNSKLHIKFGHYGDFNDYFYIFREKETQNGVREYKEGKFSADEMNALAEFLAE